MMNIKIFTTEGFGDVAVEGANIFFDRATILFDNFIIQTLHISSFILVYVDIFHIVNIVML